MISDKKVKFESQKYRFVALFTEEEKNYFEIYAICKSSGKCSCINTLNAILSEYGIDGEDIRVGEPIWEISDIEVKKFREITNSVSNSPSFLEYLDNKLDEDRRYGDWLNVSAQKIVLNDYTCQV